MLNEQQKEQFWKDGYLLVENVVSQESLQAMKESFAGWVEESREHTEPYGDTLDGRPRYDVEPGHTAEKPGLRRVNAPIEVSAAYFDAMADSGMTDAIAGLIGPNVKFHHSKINAKLPGGTTAVKWHQDFPFTPHSNDDLITALLMVDEVTEENGPLEVIPGSHTGPIHDLWHDGVFTGSVDNELAEKCQSKAIRCIGPAGSVCLMHTRLLHGSAPNMSSNSRNLFICVYSAEDAVPYAANPMPTEHEGMLVRGERTNSVRSKQFEMKLPQKPTTASFFDQQDKHKVA
ncbi:phytanoyl-CoA dioxygenase family protein [Granulosicoccus antarcticus]|uniref:Ectoine dioxygenase n=1 Tax=Granulosicoccus antarcticus IMCC3135 TaxID=1192854 RepID=A0A2Z2NY08_9GAMM|nr:phytanoyl-CoA dioxygenase family protein [Granulosicoccus antarcticus]ASJ76326.1 Ectoine dioxygenase [Granulosicoccus antarcticus IMCC3135]